MKRSAGRSTKRLTKGLVADLPAAGLKKSVRSPRQCIVIAIFLLLSVIVAVYGLGLSYESVVNSSATTTPFHDINGDGWMNDGAEIAFQGLASYGNRLSVRRESGEPGDGSPRVGISVCGKSVSFISPGTKIPESISLDGACHPRTVSFTVDSSPVGFADPQSQFGIDLTSFQVTSAIGVPLVREKFLVATTAAILTLSFMLWWVFPNKLCQAGAWIVFPVAFLLLVQNTDGTNLGNLGALWLLCASVVLGAAFGMAFGRESPVSNNPKLDAGPLVTSFVWLSVVAGGLLRIYGIDFGLPGEYHPDEQWKVKAVLDMQEHGDLNPRYFLHPSLLLYTSYFVDTVFQWLGPKGPETVFLAGRTVSAVAGTLSIYLVYAIGRRLYHPAVGVLAGGLVAVLPLHVTSSRYMKEDALLLFFVLACVLCTLKAVYERKQGWLLLAGLLGGFAASTKYSGVLSFVIFAAAPWLRSNCRVPDRDFLKSTVLAALLFPLGFVLGTPYSLVESDLFFSGLGYEKDHMLGGHSSAIDAWSQYWMYHLSRSIIPAMTFPGIVVALLGAGLLLWRRRVEDVFLLALVLLFYLPSEWVKAKPAPQPERYILPCLPFLALSAAEFVRALWYTKRRIVPVGLVILLVGFPAFRAVTLTSEIKNDTRQRMALWMTQNIPHGSHIYLEVEQYGPRFWNDEFITRPITESSILATLDVDRLKISGFDYLVLSSLSYDRYFTAPGPASPLREWFREIFERVPIVKEIQPRHGTYGFHNPTLTLFSLKEADFDSLEHELALKREGKLMHTKNELLTTFGRLRGG